MMKIGVVFLLIISSFLATGCGSDTAGAPMAERGTPSNKDEIVLPPSEQSAGVIQVQVAALSEEPDVPDGTAAQVARRAFLHSAERARSAANVTRRNATNRVGPEVDLRACEEIALMVAQASLPAR